MNYPNIQLLINGVWKDATGSARQEVVNPANGQTLGNYALAGKADMDEALVAAEKGFHRWSRMPAIERSAIMQKAAQLLRDRNEEIARLITLDEGKPLAEARMEIKSGADLIDWFAQEARRVYGREIPARVNDVTQIATREPIGPAIGFTPWNFPSSQILRKMGPALAAGCSILIKGPENTPASPMAVFKCFQDAGVPEGTIGLIFGVPAEVSEYCIPHPSIRKVTFTGSVPVGKHLAGLAGQHMKRVTMELGGHAPVIIMEDADVNAAVDALVGFKFRNAGQVCISPTRFLVHADVHDAFVSRFTEKTLALQVGDGFGEQTTMGPLIDEKRRTAVANTVKQAVENGASLVTGGKIIEGNGYFYEPTILADVKTDMSIMNNEPFGPVALFQSFHTIEEALQEANRLPYGLASYAWTRSQRHALHLARGIQAGMLTINHLGLALAETPYGGVQDSGYGSEGGPEAVEAYLQTKFVSCLHQ